MTVDPGLANRLPGIAVGSDQLRMQLSDDELRTVAFVSHAVSPVTSYLAISPDAAPSTIGVSEGEIGGLGLRGVGCGGCGGSSTCGWGKAGRGVDLQARLSSLLAPGIAACEQRHAVPAMGSLRLEATSDEVVAVDVGANTTGLAECVTEAAWALRLSPEFRGHRHFEIGLSR